MGKDKFLQSFVLIADLVLLTLSFSGYFLLFETLDPYTTEPVYAKRMLVTLIVAFFISFLLFPSITQNRFSTPGKVIQRVIITNILCTLFTTIMTISLRPDDYFPRLFFFSYMIVFTGLLIVERLFIRAFLKHMRTNKRNLRHVVLVGNNYAIHELFDYLSQPWYGYNILGIFYDGEKSDDEKFEEYHKGGYNELFTWLKERSEVHELYAYFPYEEQSKTNILAKFCDNNLIRFYFVPSLNVFNSGFAPDQRGKTLVVARRQEPLTYPWNRMLKRGFDILFSATFLITIYPWIYLWVAFKIKRQSPGPIYFNQERTGLDGKVFKCKKFRSMHVNDDADKVQATANDPRKFPFGDFMRRTNIDELPQFINVLKGEMSVVGPRPHMLKHTEEYSQIINRFMVRHLAKPGITGLAQVSGFRGETKYIRQMEGRVKKDIEYIENWSFMLDIQIIWWTIRNMIRGEENAY